jgi:hypothetical protein
VNPYDSPSAAAYQAPAQEPVGASSGVQSKPSVQYCRLLKVANDTKEPVTVYLQYETLDNENQWIWVPGNGEKDGRLGPYTIAAGQSLYLKHQGVIVYACRATLTASSRSGRSWTGAAEKDRWLVEENARGERVYQGNEPETYTWHIRPTGLQ